MECLKTLGRMMLVKTGSREGRWNSVMGTHNRLCEIGGIGVRLETFAGISRVLRRQVRREVIKSAYVPCQYWFIGSEIELKTTYRSECCESGQFVREVCELPPELQARCRRSRNQMSSVVIVVSSTLSRDVQA